ncbi:MAG: response regulator transcription factor [Flavobacteriales bacterium]|nr:response regulator transcription factor [Flavobacteriales bacterium]
MESILVIEDDQYIVDLVKIHLRDLGYAVEHAATGPEGLELAKKNNSALIVLDVMLPGLDGIQLCQRIRALDIDTPILMLTAKSEEFDKVMGLESGADDYLTKPFGVREFIARVKAILRREQRKAKSPSGAEGVLKRYGELVIDVTKRKVFVEEKRITLTPKEYDLLVLLAQNAGRHFSREQLLEQVWGYEFSGYEHTVSSHVNRLRTKIETELSNPKYILTSWGVGYHFNDELPVN